MEGESEWEGRLEVCLSQRWGTVSSDGWSHTNTHVICNDFGYDFSGIIIHTSVLIISANSTMFFPCHFSLTAPLLTPLFEDCLIENIFKNYRL